ncbi:hypothetical protein EYF80_017114 [Liparis tanakae]|uniref:Uncharacterized protein n=1 Tax=Liparis tanakae TaxID=230148 RepID=A0A4Z2I5D2_9TELE|nr:hypothetical protein EYF80_017114 [Liparis tanakae]
MDVINGPGLDEMGCLAAAAIYSKPSAPQSQPSRARPVEAVVLLDCTGRIKSRFYVTQQSTKPPEKQHNQWRGCCWPMQQTAISSQAQVIDKDTTGHRAKASHCSTAKHSGL